jgi:hypothetical protein
MRSHTGLEGIPAVAGHPLRRLPLYLGSVLPQFRQVVERIGTAKLAGVDGTHEDLARVAAVLGFKEECVLPVKNSCKARGFHHPPW